MKIILIGTSPVMLLQALILSRKYKNIEIHEKKNFIGGSWKTSDFYKIKNIETGTHILAPWKSSKLYNKSINFLKRRLNLRLNKLVPPPIRIINKNISKKELNKINYHYIKGGSHQILENIYKKLKKKNEKIFFGSFIKKILINKIDKTKIIFTNKKKIYASRVYLPYFIDIKNNFRYKKKIFNTVPEIRNSFHVVIEILNKKFFYKKNFSYIQVAKFSKFIDRASNLKFSGLTKKNNLICVRLNYLGKKELKKNKKRLIKRLVIDFSNYFYPSKFKIYSGPKKIKFKYKVFNYKTFYRSKKKIENLKKFIKQKKCNLVDTRELIQYISKNISLLEKNV